VLDRVIRFGIDRKMFERHLRELVASDDLTGATCTAASADKDRTDAPPVQAVIAAASVRSPGATAGPAGSGPAVSFSRFVMWCVVPGHAEQVGRTWAISAGLMPAAGTFPEIVCMVIDGPIENRRIASHP